MAGFGHMTQQLMTVADRKVALVLEGGYMLDSLSDCSEACLRALLNEKVCDCFQNSLHDKLVVYSVLVAVV